MTSYIRALWVLIVSSPLLTTKLFIPRPNQELVTRARLFEKLKDGFRTPLTLVSAPAGFGKTTLVSEWIHKVNSPAAWLSLDQSDNDISRFLSYFITALQHVQPNFANEALTALQSAQFPSVDTILTAILNEISECPEDFILVLDDYHVIVEKSVHDAVELLIDQMPPKMHLVILSRADPPLPLSRLRVRRQMVEVRASDLRFTKDEAALFFNDSMSLDLTNEEIEVLESKTEGWVAGLQLAGLSLEGRSDRSEFVASFSGSNRYIIDYLIDEVISRQTKELQIFLCQTSILDSLSAPLCDAITGVSGSNEVLRGLESANLFIIPQDDQRNLYRYHHLFAEFLRQRLNESQPELVPELHRRASDWYERQGRVEDAVGHAIASGDFERAATLIEPNLENTRWAQGRPTVLLKWIDALPRDLVISRPRLCLSYAWDLFSSGKYEDIEPLLATVEISISEDSSLGELGFRPPELPSNMDSLLGEVAAIRAFNCFKHGELARSIDFARDALELLPEDNPFIRGSVALILGPAYRASGLLTKASQAYSEALVIGKGTNNMMVTCLATGAMIQLEVSQGNLNSASRIYGQATFLADAKNSIPFPSAGIAFVGMGEVFRERNDLQAARDILLKGIELAKQQLSLGEYAIEGYFNLARVMHAGGDTEGSLIAMQHAERLLEAPDAPPIRFQALTYRARLWLDLGKTTEAAHWADSRNLTPTEAFPQTQHDKHIILARVSLARGDAECAIELLDYLLNGVGKENQLGQPVEVLVLKALALHLQGLFGEALDSLEKALHLAEEEGYIRLFLECGAPMHQLLKEAQARLICPGYVSELLRAFDQQNRNTEKADILAQDPQPQLTNSGLRLQLLNDRELEILGCMAAGLSNRDIANKLYLSINTIKWHIRNLYGKLGVNKRSEALVRGRETGIL